MALNTPMEKWGSISTNSIMNPTPISRGSLKSRQVLLLGAFKQRDDNSIWVDLSDVGLDEKLLLRKDGTSVYMTQDIGTAILRFKDYPALDRQVYTVGNEQEYHFQSTF